MGEGRLDTGRENLIPRASLLPVHSLSPAKETLGKRVGKKLDYNAVTVETLVSCISEAIDIFSAEFVIIMMIIMPFVCPRQYL